MLTEKARYKTVFLTGAKLGKNKHIFVYKQNSFWVDKKHYIISGKGNLETGIRRRVFNTYSYLLRFDFFSPLLQY
jgi:hypothetical protein